MSYPNVQIKIILQAVDQATATLRRASESVRSLTNQLKTFKDVAKIAAGVLIRDFALSLGRNIKEASELGAKYVTLRNAFRNLVGDVDEAAELFRALRKATRGTVSAVELLQAANQALALGIPKDELADLFEAARRLGAAMGKDTVSSINDLVTGLGRLSGKILDNLGITFQATDAYEWYARQIGKTVAELTELDRRMAWQLYAMELIKEKAYEVGDAQSAAQETTERWRAATEDFKTTIGRFIGPLGEFGNIIGGFLTPTILLIDKWEKLGGVLSKITGPIAAVSSALGPWKWAIIGIIAATLLLAWAWKNNILGIRDITQKAVDAITTSLKKLGKWLDNTLSSFEQWINAVADRWIEFQRKISERLNLDEIVEKLTGGKNLEQVIEDAINRTNETIDDAVNLVENVEDLIQEGVTLDGGIVVGPTYTLPQPTPPPSGGPSTGAERFASGVLPVNVTNIVHVDRIESDYDVERIFDVLERRRIEAYRRLF